ncbi:MAG: hypothetical protein WB493_00165 [Anaeromyxobacteraceae bacterium]
MAEGILLTVVVLFSILAFLPPIEDPDFWWHLRTGDLISASGGLPAHDPFSFASKGAPPVRAGFILSSYWLAQLSYHLLFALGGAWGVVAGRAILLSLTFGTGYVRMRRFGVDRILAAVLLAGSVAMYSSLYFGDRPQVYSFLGAGLLAWWMDRIRSGREPSALILPLMAIWSNLHGGFVIGDLLLVAFAVGALVEFRSMPGRLVRILAWVAGGILVSFANPNGFGAIPATLELGRDPLLLTFVDEYQSTAELFSMGRHSIAVAWGLIACLPAAMFLARRVYWPDLFVWAVAGALAARYARNVGFYLVVVVPTCGYYLQQALTTLRGRRVRPFALAGLVSIAVVLMVQQTGRLLDRGSPLREGVSGQFPEGAAQFLSRTPGAHRVFNEYDWGGYLLWRNFPGQENFIDGRILDPRRVVDYARVLWAVPDGPDGAPSYARLLDDWRIDAVIQRLYMEMGNVPPLILALLDDPMWIPAYVDDQAVVLLRSPRPLGEQEWLARRAMWLSRTLGVLDDRIARGPADFRPHLARAQFLATAGLLDEARRSVLAARQLAPQNPFVIDLSARLGL